MTLSCCNSSKWNSQPLDFEHISLIEKSKLKLSNEYGQSFYIFLSSRQTVDYCGELKDVELRHPFDRLLLGISEFPGEGCPPD
jgi:hypothetical protein